MSARSAEVIRGSGWRGDVDEKAQQDWLRLKDAAVLAGYSRTRLHYAAADGELPFAIVGGQRFFLASDVLTWRDERRSPSTAGSRR
jgi:Helix-turn-helix domain